MAIKTISQFPSGTPASNDKVLFEQNGEGKSATLASLPVPTSVQSKLDTKVNYSDALTYEQVMASTDLTNKVASASAIETFIQQGFDRINIYYGGSEEKDFVTFKNVKISYRTSALLIGSSGGAPLFRSCALFTNGDTTTNSVSAGTISASDNGNGTANLTFTGSIASWSRLFLVVFSQKGNY